MQKFYCLGRRDGNEYLERVFFEAKDMSEAIEKAEAMFADIYCLRPCTEEEFMEHF